MPVSPAAWSASSVTSLGGGGAGGGGAGGGGEVVLAVDGGGGEVVIAGLEQSAEASDAGKVVGHVILLSSSYVPTNAHTVASYVESTALVLQ